MVMAPGTVVRFEDFGESPELWGATQANFMVVQPAHHAIEAAVMLNTPASAFLAAALNVEQTPEFRREITRIAGAAWIEHLAESGESIASIMTLSRAALEASPAVVERIVQAYGLAVPHHG